jgi:hypothetical protein
MGGVLPVAPVGYNTMLTDYIKPDQTFVTCPNQDVAYGAGFTALDKEPTVFQVPDFGDRFWVYALYDARTDEIAEIGKPYGTKPGFYMVVGPNWKGQKPAGITAVVRSSTELVFAVPRIFKDDTVQDTKAIQPILSQIQFYPLSEFDGKMKTTDWSKLPHFPAPPSSGGETKWVVPEKFYDQLPGVMKLVPPLPGEGALYGWINSVFAAAAKDPATKEALIASFVAAEKELIAPLFQWKNNGRSAGNGWNTQDNNAQWGSDYLLGLSAFHVEAFAARDRAWALGDGRFFELNDWLQYLGMIAFRAPVPAYKHTCAQFLKLRGVIPCDAPHPRGARRPDSDLPLLADIAVRLESLTTELAQGSNSSPSRDIRQKTP